MKAIKLIFTCMVILISYALLAQDTVNKNLVSPPPWGPAGYSDVRYYYLPDVESYYDIYAAQFVCNIEGEWLHRNRLPSPNRNYDLYEGYKIVMEDYQGNAPYKFFEDQKVKYPIGYRGPVQKTIGERPDKGNSGKKNKE
jgi:hypothetical protein